MEQLINNLLIQELIKDIKYDLIKSLDSENIKYNNDDLLILIDKHIKLNNFTFINHIKNKELIKKKKFDNKENRCMARLWNKSYCGQCTMTYTDFSNKLCKKHSNLFEKNGCLRFGFINEKIPIRDNYNNNKLNWNLI